MWVRVKIKTGHEAGTVKAGSRARRGVCSTVFYSGSSL